MLVDILDQCPCRSNSEAARPTTRGRPRAGAARYEQAQSPLVRGRTAGPRTATLGAAARAARRSVGAIRRQQVGRRACRRRAASAAHALAARGPLSTRARPCTTAQAAPQRDGVERHRLTDSKLVISGAGATRRLAVGPRPPLSAKFLFRGARRGCRRPGVARGRAPPPTKFRR